MTSATQQCRGAVGGSSTDLLLDVSAQEVLFFAAQLALLLLGRKLYLWYYKAYYLPRKMLRAKVGEAAAAAPTTAVVAPSNKLPAPNSGAGAAGASSASSLSVFAKAFLGQLPVHLQAMIVSRGLLGVSDVAALSGASTSLWQQVGKSTEVWHWMLVSHGFALPPSSCCGSEWGLLLRRQLPPADLLREAFRLAWFGVEDFANWRQRRTSVQPVRDDVGKQSQQSRQPPQQPPPQQRPLSNSELLADGLKAVQGLVPQDDQDLKNRVASAVIALLRWYDSNDDEARDKAEKLARRVMECHDVFRSDQIQDTEDAFAESQELFKMLTDVSRLTEEALLEQEAAAIANMSQPATLAIGGATGDGEAGPRRSDPSSTARQASTRLFHSAETQAPVLSDLCILDASADEAAVVAAVDDGDTGDDNSKLLLPPAISSNELEDTMALIISTLREIVDKNQVRKQMSDSEEAFR